MLPDGEPHGFTFILGFDDFLLEFVEPLAGFEELAYNLVATYEDAACSVGGGITHVNTDAAEEAVEERLLHYVRPKNGFRQGFCWNTIA